MILVWKKFEAQSLINSVFLGSLIFFIPWNASTSLRGFKRSPIPTAILSRRPLAADPRIQQGRLLLCCGEMFRTVVRRAVDWGALGSKLSSDSAKAELSRLRAVAGEITALSNTYSSPPPPIDFAAYKSKISAEGVVEKFEVRARRRRLKVKGTTGRGALFFFSLRTLQLT